MALYTAATATAGPRHRSGGRRCRRIAPAALKLYICAAAGFQKDTVNEVSTYTALRHMGGGGGEKGGEEGVATLCHMSNNENFACTGCQLHRSSNIWTRYILQRLFRSAASQLQQVVGAGKSCTSLQEQMATFCYLWPSDEGSVCPMALQFRKCTGFSNCTHSSFGLLSVSPALDSEMSSALCWSFSNNTELLYKKNPPSVFLA